MIVSEMMQLLASRDPNEKVIMLTNAVDGKTVKAVDVVGCFWDEANYNAISNEDEDVDMKQYEKATLIWPEK